MNSPIVADPFSDQSLGLTLVGPAQLEPRYLAALQELNQIKGAGKFAAAINLVARIWGLDPAQVLKDAVSEVPA